MKSRLGFLFVLLVVASVAIGVWLAGGGGRSPTPIAVPDAEVRPKQQPPPAPLATQSAPLPAPPASAPAAPAPVPAASVPPQPQKPAAMPFVQQTPLPPAPAGTATRPGGPVVSSGGSASSKPPPKIEPDAFADARQDIETASLMFRDFRTIMGQNPVGTNAEIMKAINGGNPKGARLMHEGQQLNGNGELVDRWGTPYFFHQMSATNMEITSAGPDKIFGTSDDIVGR